MKLEKKLEKIIKITKKAGKIVKKGYFNLDKKTTDKKNTLDLVTEYDKKIDILLEKKLKKLFPDLEYIGEEKYELLSESEKLNLNNKLDNAIIVDPIDGTRNFTEGLAVFCISIAIRINGEDHFGIIYNPITKELYYAIKGKGSFYNNTKIEKNKQVRNMSRINFGNKTGHDYTELEQIEKNKVFDNFINAKEEKLNIISSAAWESCLLAKKSISKYVLIGVSIWDIAAAKIIIEEAGGTILDINTKKKFVVDKINNISIISENKNK
jgi:myo-inositol-1(or 4)-monophosphatase